MENCSIPIQTPLSCTHEYEISKSFASFSAKKRAVPDTFHGHAWRQLPFTYYPLPTPTTPTHTTPTNSTHPLLQPCRSDWQWTLTIILFYGVFALWLKNSVTYLESPEISPRLIYGERPILEHKIGHIYETMVLSVGTWSNFWGRPYLLIVKWIS